MKSVIHAFGTYLPRYRILSEEIARSHGRDAEHARGLGIVQKTVNAPDEDSFTMAWEASKNALEGADVTAEEIQAVYVGSESHPYAVKPTSGMLAHALGTDPFSRCADLQFACKAGTAALQIVSSMVKSGEINYGLAVGSDTAQSRPGDILEYSAAAGAAAFIVGNATKTSPGLCCIETTASYTTDTPDFWRAAEDRFPEHAGRFTGEPAYFHHIEAIVQRTLKENAMTPKDIDHAVFHMPNAKFPVEAARRLGFTEEQLRAGFIVPTVGNTYAACSLLGLASVLRTAKKGQTILLASYGSGAGADAFILTMLKDGKAAEPEHETPIFLTYPEYLRHKGLVASM